MQGWYSPQREFKGKVWDTQSPRPLTPLHGESTLQVAPVPVAADKPILFSVDEQEFAALDATKCVVDHPNIIVTTYPQTRLQLVTF
eukprot:SAG31_NODE_20184_length_581_cov_1.238589_1_plen_86_part_00